MKMKRIFRSVFASPLLVVKNLGRISLNNFVGGLIFGALFSLLVNVATVQLQEMIQRQRVFEALEHEVAGNFIHANGTMERNLSRLENKETPSIYYSPQGYSREVWGTAEALKYIVQLNPEIQSRIITYYGYVIDANNNLLERDTDLARQRLSGCYINFEGLPKDESESCLTWYHQIIANESSSAEAVSDESFKILNIFHPTQDRLNSPILKLLMGGEAVEILKGPN